MKHGWTLVLFAIISMPLENNALQLPLNSSTSSKVQLPNINSFINFGKSISAPLSTLGLYEDSVLNFTELANKYGEYCEEHAVLTEDGYILTLFHIPGDVSKSVLLTHGGLQSADAWIVRGEISLAIILARRRYDVWAIDLRGAKYSRKHIRFDLHRDQYQFFNYSFYDQGYYDLPATIDYILERTGQIQIAAIGHSYGAAAFTVLGAERPEYNEKVKILVGLAPVVFLNNQRGLITKFFDLVLLMNSIGLISINQNGGVESFGPRLQLVIQTACKSPLTVNICQQLLFSVIGYDPAGLEMEFVPTVLSYLGATSSKNFLHSIQNYKSSKFARYVYRSEKPPVIDLSKVVMKTALMVGKEDYLSSVRDSAHLRDSLGNVVYYQVMPYDRFNHVDFVLGRYMVENLYPYLLPLLETFM